MRGIETSEHTVNGKILRKLTNTLTGLFMKEHTMNSSEPYINEKKVLQTIKLLEERIAYKQLILLRGISDALAAKVRQDIRELEKDKEVLETIYKP